jgi:hypothetical protein
MLKQNRDLFYFLICSRIYKVDGRDPQNREKKNFVGGRSCGRKRCAREINVSRVGDPVHAGDKALTRETPAQRGRVNRYATLNKVESCIT